MKFTKKKGYQLVALTAYIDRRIKMLDRRGYSDYCLFLLMGEALSFFYVHWLAY